jgi:transcription initiation factor IIE alpha subunit
VGDFRWPKIRIMSITKGHVRISLSEQRQNIGFKCPWCSQTLRLSMSKSEFTAFRSKLNHLRMHVVYICADNSTRQFQ